MDEDDFLLHLPALYALFPGQSELISSAKRLFYLYTLKNPLLYSQQGTRH
jgi:hypothetical protein